MFAYSADTETKPDKPMRHFLLLALISISLIGCRNSSHTATAPGQVQEWQRDIIYHVFQRSFYDADGDRHGDFLGAARQLDYLQELGVTTVMFTPIYESHFYHNYFPTDYERIDPRYGSKADYLHFVRETHLRGLKFFLDQEVQYASNGHPWFDKSLHYPNSPYAKFIYYNDSLNQKPEPGYFHIEFLQTYDNKAVRLTHLDLNQDTVRHFMQDYFQYWIDPNRDGRLDDGVDGFRIDHMMDDLDFKGKFTNLYQAFWQPIIDKSRARNPNIFFLAEQALWDYGDDLLQRCDVDAVFGFPIRAGILAFDAPTLAGKVDSMLALTPAGRQFVVFIENHDTDRFASVVAEDVGKLRIGAALNLLLPGIPSIYYGQELGLTGVHGTWGHDGNDIPRREAFPWYEQVDAPGHALWYRDSGPWWDQSIYATGRSAALSLERQRRDSASLFHFYKRLIAIRKTNPAFYAGDFRWIDAGDNYLLAFSREVESERSLVVANLSDQRKTLPLATLPSANYRPLLAENVHWPPGENVVLPPFALIVLLAAK